MQLSYEIFSSIFGSDENLTKVEKRRVQIIIRNLF